LGVIEHWRNAFRRVVREGAFASSLNHEASALTPTVPRLAHPFATSPLQPPASRDAGVDPLSLRVGTWARRGHVRAPVARSAGGPRGLATTWIDETKIRTTDFCSSLESIGHPDRVGYCTLLRAAVRTAFHDAVARFGGERSRLGRAFSSRRARCFRATSDVPVAARDLSRSAKTDSPPLA
jgi:hypothetical protein